MPTTQETSDLKKVVKRGLREPNRWFAEEETVVLPQAGGKQYWRSLRVKLLAYAYGKGDEDDEDEPEFIIAASSDGAHDLVHEPTVADPPEVGKNVRVLPDRRVLLHQSLDDEQVHEFFVICSAFDSDSDTAWHGVVQGLQTDLRNVGSAAIGSSMLAGFQSPTALMNFVIQHAGDAATDDPEQIGGQEVVLDLRQEFRRPADMFSWTAHKWTLFSKGADDPWYLALWRIELDARAGALSRASLDREDRATDVGRLRDALHVPRTELAAVRMLQGETGEQVAAALDLSKAQVSKALAAFMDRDSDEIAHRLTAVALEELKLLRKKPPL